MIRNGQRLFIDNLMDSVTIVYSGFSSLMRLKSMQPFDKHRRVKSEAASLLP
jgi:hypothetical protein